MLKNVWASHFIASLKVNLMPTDRHPAGDLSCYIAFRMRPCFSTIHAESRRRVHRPIAPPEGALDFEAVHEGRNGALDGLLVQRHWHVDAVHVHADLLHQAPALREQHGPADKPELSLAVGQHQAQVFLHQYGVGPGRATRPPYTKCLCLVQFLNIIVAIPDLGAFFLPKPGVGSN